MQTVWIGFLCWFNDQFTPITLNSGRPGRLRNLKEETSAYSLESKELSVLLLLLLILFLSLAVPLLHLLMPMCWEAHGKYCCYSMLSSSYWIQPWRSKTTSPRMMESRRKTKAKTKTTATTTPTHQHHQHYHRKTATTKPFLFTLDLQAGSRPFQTFCSC